MTPQEKALIDSVFDRLAQTASAPKDPDALAYIRDRAGKLPDAAYGLTQAVLIQEMALNAASTRITQLEHQLSQQEGQPAQGSSFLGGATAASSAGPWGTRPTQAQPQPQPQPQAPQPQYQAQPQYQYQQPQYQQPAAGPWGAPAGGGFLRNAASMAAGVAGGTLLAEGIASLFGGHHLYGGYGGFGGGLGGAGYGPWGGQPGMAENVENITVNNYGDANTAAGSENLPQMDDPNLRDASFDDSGDSSSNFDDGGFDGGSDFSDV